MLRTLVFAGLLSLLGTATAAPQAQTLLQLVDYVGVDYPAAVQDGTVVNEFEYAEMVEFVALIRDGVAALPETEATPELQRLARELGRTIEARAPAGEILDLTRTMRGLILSNYDLALVPRQAPDLARGAKLYATHCASCHGATGRGDGPAAAALAVPPTNFHDVARATQRSLFGLYNTITLGVAGTGMASFAQLSDAQRWALAFYVGGFYADQALLEQGQAAWEADKLSLEQATTLSPDEIGVALGPDGQALAAYVRSRPEMLFSGQPGPMETARTQLQASLAAYRQGQADQAGNLAVTAYLEGFELAEAALRNVAPDLVVTVEEAMIGLRNAIADGAPVEQVAARVAEIDGLLARAQTSLEEASLGRGVAFTASLVILLREGLEAILILAAIAAFMIKTNRRDALKYLHYGWLGALAAGGLTWFVSAYVISISGATREITEGITALFAAGILFYVGFWMHNKLNARRWNKFLQSKIQSALDEQALWTLALVSFIAVYREVFETILFYQALWVQVDVGAYGALFGGMAAAALLLVVATWAIFKFGLRLPLKQFFAITGSIMIVLAVIFAGKGVVALQEAGKLPISPVDFPRIELLGIYPNLQSLLLQAILIAIAAGLIFYNRRAEAYA